MSNAASPRLATLVERARRAASSVLPALGLVYPCDSLALEAALAIAADRIARPVLIGPREPIQQAADLAGLDISAFELINSGMTAPEAARHATALARQGVLGALMKGSLHTDELMSAVVDKAEGLRTARRISHAFLFDLPRYHKLLCLSDCVVNITPDLRTKRDILSNAIELLQQLGIAAPRVAIVAAVEAVNPAITATLDAHELVRLAGEGAWPNATIEGPFGFDNAFSAEAARTKKMDSRVAGNADLMLMPDLNAGNMLYKSFNYVGGGDCAGLVLGTSAPIVLTSRADTKTARVASAALAILAIPGLAPLS